MCIAIYSEKGNDLPCETYLKNSFDNNPDGAGYAFNTDDGRVQIHKGLMTWESFKAAFFEDAKKFDFKNRGVLIHFRIATHGGTVPECTHPFPLIDDVGSLHKLKITTNYAVIHNGIIYLTSADASKTTQMSDTMVFIQKYMTKIATNKDWFYNTENMELIYGLAASKIAVLNGKGEIISTTGFVKAADGNYYSNGTYAYGPTSYYDYGGYYGGHYGGKRKSYKNWDEAKDYYDDYYSRYGWYDDDDEAYSQCFFAQKMSPEMYFVLSDNKKILYSDKEDYFISTNGLLYRGPKGIGKSYRISKKDCLEYVGKGTAFLAKSGKEFTPYGSVTILYDAIKGRAIKSEENKDNEKKGKLLTTATYVPAHLLGPNELILSDEGETYYAETDVDDECYMPIFITDLGEILVAENGKEIDSQVINDTDLYLVGQGVLTDLNCTAIDQDNSYLLNLELVTEDPDTYDEEDVKTVDNDPENDETVAR